MKIGIHQPHYFPWAGYLNKMCSVDKFILLDKVQFEKGSYMNRNRILNDKGQIKYLTVSADTHGFLDKSYCDIVTVNDEEFLKRQREEIIRSYKEAPYFDTIWELIRDLFGDKERTLCAYCVRSILRLKDILDIKTPVIMQSDIDAGETGRKNDLVIGLVKAVGGDEYLSGNGARKYNDESRYDEEGIKLSYQTYSMPPYSQVSSAEFVPGLSVIDTLFNCGIDGTKRIIGY